jgi:hypothetical protein
MPDAESNEQRPDLDFEFAPGWPADVQEQVRLLFSFDLDEVQGRDRLGSLYFDTAPELIEAIRAMVRDLSQEPWDELPASITGDHLRQQLQTLNDVLGQMAALSADHENAASQKSQFDNQLGQIHEWFRSQVRPHAITARVNRRIDEALAGTDGDTEAAYGERVKRLAELDRRVDALQRNLDSREDLVSGLREAAGESAGEELSNVFHARAQELGDSAKTWFRALVGSGVGALVGAVVTFMALRPERGEEDPADFAALGLGLFIIGLLVFAVRICAQNYRVHRHLQAVAKSKAAALSTFKRLIASIEEAEIRSSVALVLAQAVFATEDTGLVDSSGDHVTLVERALAPRVGGTAPTT